MKTTIGIFTTILAGTMFLAGCSADVTPGVSSYDDSDLRSQIDALKAGGLNNPTPTPTPTPAPVAATYSFAASCTEAGDVDNEENFDAWTLVLQPVTTRLTSTGSTYSGTSDATGAITIDLPIANKGNAMTATCTNNISGTVTLGFVPADQTAAMVFDIAADQLYDDFMSEGLARSSGWSVDSIPAAAYDALLAAIRLDNDIQDDYETDNALASATLQDFVAENLPLYRALLATEELCEIVLQSADSGDLSHGSTYTALDNLGDAGTSVTVNADGEVATIDGLTVTFAATVNGTVFDPASLKLVDPDEMDCAAGIDESVVTDLDATLYTCVMTNTLEDDDDNYDEVASVSMLMHFENKDDDDEKDVSSGTKIVLTDVMGTAAVPAIIGTSDEDTSLEATDTYVVFRELTDTDAHLVVEVIGSRSEDSDDNLSISLSSDDLTINLDSDYEMEADGTDGDQAWLQVQLTYVATDAKAPALAQACAENLPAGNKELVKLGDLSSITSANAALLVARTGCFSGSTGHHEKEVSAHSINYAGGGHNNFTCANVFGPNRTLECYTRDADGKKGDIVRDVTSDSIGSVRTRVEAAAGDNWFCDQTASKEDEQEAGASVPAAS